VDGVNARAPAREITGSRRTPATESQPDETETNRLVQAFQRVDVGGVRSTVSSNATETPCEAETRRLKAIEEREARVKAREEAILKQQAEREAALRAGEELLRQQAAREAQIKMQEEALRRQQEEALRRQQEEALRRQQEKNSRYAYVPPDFFTYHDYQQRPHTAGSLGGVATGRTHVSSGSANGRALYTGPRGGTYYVNANGNKTYVSSGRRR